LKKLVAYKIILLVSIDTMLSSDIWATMHRASFDIWSNCLSTFSRRLITLVVLGSFLFWAESQLGSSEDDNEIIDWGFYLTTGASKFLEEHVTISYILSGMNSCYNIGFTFWFLLYRPLFNGDIPCGTAFTLGLVARTICGSFTKLPIHSTAQLNENELPNMFTGNRFFMFFSGHTCFSELGRKILKYEGRTHFARLLRFLNFLQAVRLIATRGHYTIDVITGYAFSFPLYEIYVWSKKRIEEKSKIYPTGAKID